MTVELVDVSRLIGTLLGTGSPSAGDRLVEDLRAESLDIMMLVAEIEDRFGVVIEDEEIRSLRTVGDVHRRVLAG